jgi:hypothetical protein
MILNWLLVLTIGVSGWVFGRSRPAFNLPVLVLTLFAAITAHSALQWAFLEGRMDVVTGDPRRDAPQAAMLIIAAVESAGLWLPFLLLPWTTVTPRVSAAVYALAAAALAVVYHYFPFDLVVISASLIAPDGPPYLFAWFACLPIAAAGMLVGWLQSSREQANRDDDLEIDRLAGPTE